MTSRDLASAFDLLARVVADYCETGRRSYSAGLKPELQRRTPSFDEKALGFETFREFLRAAEGAQVVDLHPATRGPDIVVVPHGQPVPAAPVHPAPSRTPVRSDLWKAWVDWTPGYRKVYDRVHDAAERIPSVPTVALDGRQRELAEALEAGDDRVVPIPGIPIEEHLAWTAEFAAGAGDAAPLLQEALRKQRPAMEFAAALRRMPSVAARWRGFQLERVRAVLKAWAAEHGLDIAIDAPVPTAVAPPSRHESDTGGSSGGESDVEVEELRRRAHHAVDRMSATELGDLRIPLHALSALFA